MQNKNQDLLRIKIFYNKKVFLISNQIYLEAYATSLNRKFTFKGIDSEFRKVFSPYEYYAFQKITISVKFMCEGKFKELFKFKMVIVNYPPEITEEFWIYGTVHDYLDTGYSQKFLDVYLNWQEKNTVDWFNLSSLDKENYMVACLRYSGTNRPVILKDKYIIDISFIKEECDLSYLCSLEFIGDRGYLGIDYKDLRYNFKDMISKGHSFEGIKLYLLNIDKPYNEEMATFYKEYKKLFEECKFDVIELKSGEIIP